MFECKTDHILLVKENPKHNGAKLIDAEANSFPTISID